MSNVKYAAKIRGNDCMYLYETKRERLDDWDANSLDVVFTTIRTVKKAKPKKKKQIGHDFNWAVEQMAFGHAVTRLDWVSNIEVSIKYDYLGFVIRNDATRDAYELNKYDFQSKKWVLV